MLFIIRSVLTVKACQGNRYRLPVAGDLAGRDAHQSETGLTARDRAVKAQGRADQVTPDFVYVVVRQNSISD